MPADAAPKVITQNNTPGLSVGSSRRLQRATPTMPLVDAISMSSSAAKGAASSPSSSAKTAVSPVPVLDSPLAKGIATARPALLLALLAVRFGDLVRDPESTLTTALPIVAVIQVAYAVFCLPVAGSQLGKVSKKPRPGDKKKESGPSIATTAVLSVLLTAIATPAIHALFVLFGAPLLDHVLRTLLCAAHFAIIALFPIFYVRGVDSQALVAVAGAYAPLDETIGGLGGAALGGWLGAVPIPLDWDREWQKWPVTIVMGMYVGSCVVSKIAGTLLYGKRFGGPGGAKTE